MSVLEGRYPLGSPATRSGFGASGDWGTPNEVNGSRASRKRALVALAAIVIALGVRPADALTQGLPPLAKSPNVQLPTGRLLSP
jgi:hypothetical protein